jgi:hypothetical protein
VGGGEKLLTYLNLALKVLSGLDKKLNFVDQCNHRIIMKKVFNHYSTIIVSTIIEELKILYYETKKKAMGEKAVAQKRESRRFS